MISFLFAISAFFVATAEAFLSIPELRLGHYFDVSRKHVATTSTRTQYHPRQRPNSYFIMQSCEDNIESQSTREENFLFVSEVSRRRLIFQHSLASLMVLASTTPLGKVPPAHAKDGTTATIEIIHDAFDNVRNELLGEQGGISYMKSLIENERYDELLEFTKTYDQILRKGLMGKAKKFLIESNEKDLATQLCNNVTFDLIGINRSVRSTTANDMKQTAASKYLIELQDDITRFLTLEPKQVS
jgi:hypothetical protein